MDDKKLKVLVIGSGGREDAIVWKLKQSPLVNEIFCTPGNAGIAKRAGITNTKANDTEGLLVLAREIKPDLTIVGPEDPLCNGAVDILEKEGFKTFGPSKAAAILEGSKVFTKNFLYRHNIPTASFKSFDSAGPAKEYVQKQQFPLVIKADGLAAGKGVLICKNVAEAIKAINLIMVEKKFGEAGREIVIESFLSGEEVSYMVTVDINGNYVSMATSQDHKRVGDGDTGSNTGGMGAYSPARIMTPELDRKIRSSIIIPTILGMKMEDRPFVGILYAGLIIMSGTPYVLEYNVRLGDPETQPIMMRMKSDLVELILASLDGKLDTYKIEWDENPAVCVVMASRGYPEAYEKGYMISGIANAEDTGAVVFHAGTGKIGDTFVTAGGRVLGVTAMGESFAAAKANAYKAVEEISCDENMLFYRTDIADRAIK